ADLAPFFFSSRRRHTRSKRDWSSDVCSSDLCCWFIGNNNFRLTCNRHRNYNTLTKPTRQLMWVHFVHFFRLWHSYLIKQFNYTCVTCLFVHISVVIKSFSNLVTNTHQWVQAG